MHKLFKVFCFLLKVHTFEILIVVQVTTGVCEQNAYQSHKTVFDLAKEKEQNGQTSLFLFL